jgi:hypothetical protein
MDAAQREAQVRRFVDQVWNGRDYEAAGILHFDGDRVVSEWMGSDKLALFIQLGVVDDAWVVPAQAVAADSPSG